MGGVGVFNENSITEGYERTNSYEGHNTGLTNSFSKPYNMPNLGGGAGGSTAKNMSLISEGSYSSAAIPRRIVSHQYSTPNDTGFNFANQTREETSLMS